MSDKWDRHCGKPITLIFENADGTEDEFHLKFSGVHLPILMAMSMARDSIDEALSKKVVDMIVDAAVKGEPGTPRDKIESFVIANFADILFNLDGPALGLNPKTEKIKAKIAQMRAERGSKI